MLPDFFPQSVAVDPENICRLSLVALRLFEDHFKQGFFNSFYDEFMELSVSIAVHLGYIPLDAFIKPVFQKCMDVLFDLSHGKWDAGITADGQGLSAWIVGMLAKRISAVKVNTLSQKIRLIPFARLE